MRRIMERREAIEQRQKPPKAQEYPTLENGEKLFDNYDLCRLLGITKRTLARYRQKKLVTYYMIDGRTYYKASEVEAFLNQKGKSLPARFRHQPNV